MTFREAKAMKSLEVVLDYAFSRINHLTGKDKDAFENEFKEWLADEILTEKVWFSVPLKKN